MRKEDNVSILKEIWRLKCQFEDDSWVNVPGVSSAEAVTTTRVPGPPATRVYLGDRTLYALRAEVDPGTAEGIGNGELFGMKVFRADVVGGPTPFPYIHITGD